MKEFKLGGKKGSKNVSILKALSAHYKLPLKRSGKIVDPNSPDKQSKIPDFYRMFFSIDLDVSEVLTGGFAGCMRDEKGEMTKNLKVNAELDELVSAGRIFIRVQSPGFVFENETPVEERLRFINCLYSFCVVLNEKNEFPYKLQLLNNPNLNEQKTHLSYYYSLSTVELAPILKLKIGELSGSELLRNYLVSVAGDMAKSFFIHSKVILELIENPSIKNMAQVRSLLNVSEGKESALNTKPEEDENNAVKKSQER